MKQRAPNGSVSQVTETIKLMDIRTAISAETPKTPAPSTIQSDE